MVKFAVCDDELDAVEYISDKLREYYPDECEIKEYTDGMSLLEDNKNECFDAFFLDIGMPSLDGFELAKQLRNAGSRAKIIFVTGKEELVHMGYRFEAFRFVRKSKLNQELRETAESLNKIFSLPNEYVSFKTWTGETLVRVKDIRYFKANGHFIILYEQDEKEVCAKMKDVEELLAERGFIRIHKSYLINFRFFHSIINKNMRLLSGEELPISRNRMTEVKKMIRECCQSKDKRLYSKF